MTKFPTLLAAVALVSCATAPVSAAVPSAPITLGPHTVPPGLIVLQQAMPPPHNGAFLPMTGAWLGNPIGANLGDGSAAIWDTGWANRAVGGPAKACNPQPDSPVGPDGKQAVMCFSSHARADAVTMAEMLRKNGSAKWQVPLQRAGVTVIPEATCAASPAVCFPTFSAFDHAYAGMDEYIVPPAARVYARRPTVIGIDFEVNDGRTPAETAAFLAAFGDAARALGAQSYLYTNPWTAPVMASGGLTPATLAIVAPHFDWLSLLTTPNTRALGGQAADYAANARILRAAGIDPSRWIATFYWDSTIADACRFHALQARDHFAGYNIHPHATPPSAATYAVEAALLFGQGC